MNHRNTSIMPGTRRSTRQTTAITPKYNDDSSSASEKAALKCNAKKSTRQKRAREEDADEEVKNERSVISKRFEIAQSKVLQRSASGQKEYHEET